MIMNMHMAPKKVPGTANILKISRPYAMWSVFYNCRVFRLSNGAYYAIDVSTRGYVPGFGTFSKDALTWANSRPPFVCRNSVKTCLLNGYFYYITAEQQNAGSSTSAIIYSLSRFDGSSWTNIPAPNVWNNTGGDQSGVLPTILFTFGNDIYMGLANGDIYKYTPGDGSWYKQSITHSFGNNASKRYINWNDAVYIEFMASGISDGNTWYKFTPSQGFTEFDTTPNTGGLFVKNGLLHKIELFTVQGNKRYYKIYKYINGAFEEIGSTNAIGNGADFSAMRHVMTKEQGPIFWGSMTTLGNYPTMNVDLIYELVI